MDTDLKLHNFLPNQLQQETAEVQVDQKFQLVIHPQKVLTITSIK
jgi:hypothetical protein